VGWHAVIRLAFLTVLCAGPTAYAQTPARLEFEVASVKPSPPPDPIGQVFFGPPRGGPGTRDPGQITWTNATLLNILTAAYNITTLQIVAPDCISNERYDLIAKVPAERLKNRSA